MPRESNCWPTLNWFCVMPTSCRKKSVMALPLCGLLVFLLTGQMATEGPYMFPRSSCSTKNPMIKRGTTRRSILSTRPALSTPQSGVNTHLRTSAFSSSSVQVNSSSSLEPSLLSTRVVCFSAIPISDLCCCMTPRYARNSRGSATSMCANNARDPKEEEIMGGVLAENTGIELLNYLALGSCLVICDPARCTWQTCVLLPHHVHFDAYPVLQQL